MSRNTNMKIARLNFCLDSRYLCYQRFFLSIQLFN
jgi:hypothetical protein